MVEMIVKDKKRENACREGNDLKGLEQTRILHQIVLFRSIYLNIAIVCVVLYDIGT